MATTEFLLVGLGNPGTDYRDTRHNVGSMLVDSLVNRWNGDAGTKKYHSIFRKVRVAGVSVAFMQPLTFMNRSGLAVAEYVNFYKTTPHNIIVLHDDIDMAPGRVKLVKGGGAGGHNGIKSINSSLGFTDYYKLKIGVGRPGKNGVHPDIPVDRYVLSAFYPEQQEILAERFDAIEKGIITFLEDSPAAAATILNSLK